MANECLGCKANWHGGGWGASVGVLMMHGGNEIGQNTGKEHMRFFSFPPPPPLLFVLCVCVCVCVARARARVCVYVGG